MRGASSHLSEVNGMKEIPWNSMDSDIRPGYLALGCNRYP